jgi:hypothetical protein
MGLRFHFSMMANMRAQRRYALPMVHAVAKSTLYASPGIILGRLDFENMWSIVSPF